MTVAELIQELKKYQPNDLMIIEDADTNWYLKLSKVDSTKISTINDDMKTEVEVRIVILSASYKDEF